MKKTYFFRTLMLLSFVLFWVGNGLMAQNRNYLDFVAVDNDYVVINDNTTLDIMNSSTEYSVEAWIYLNAWTNYMRIASRYSHWDFYLRLSGQLAFRVNDGGLNYSINSAVSTGSWQHVAVIRRSGKIYFYVNGVDVSAGSYNGYALPGAGTDDNLYIGQYGDGTSDFNGYIDEFRCTNQGLTIGDLNTSIYDNQYITDGNTGALFHFNEGSGTSTLDEASSNNGTLKGIPTWTSWSSNAHLPLAYEWTGSTDTDWETATNWGGGVPTSSKDVIIPNVTGDDPSVSGDATTPSECNNLTIETGGVLTISADKALTVSGTFTNNAGNTGLVIKSTATEQGSLKHSTANVDGTVERHITEYSDGDSGWHLLSSPVATFDIDGSEFDPGDAPNTDNDLFGWNESTNLWMNYKAGDPTQIVTGEGYLTAWKDTDTKNFTGELNITDVVYEDLTVVDGKWHLLGNPFASALDWSAGIWAVSNVSIPQVYKESDGNYYGVNTVDNIIPSTQGFFVQATDADNAITIPADARVHNAKDWYKQEVVLENTLKLKLSGGNNSFCDYTLISFNNNTTEEYDIEYDSYKFFGMPSAPQMYTLSNSLDKFSYNNIPTPVGEKIIPLNIKVPLEGEYTINVVLNNLVLEGNIYLEDLLTSQLIDLSEVTTYTFQASSQNSDNRFKLHFNGSTGFDEDLNNPANTVVVYSNNNQIYVKSLNDNSLSGTMTISNIVGQIVYQLELNNSNQQLINTNLNTGIYIVTLQMESGYAISEKVIIK